MLSHEEPLRCFKHLIHALVTHVGMVHVRYQALNRTQNQGQTLLLQDGKHVVSLVVKSLVRFHITHWPEHAHNHISHFSNVQNLHRVSSQHIQKRNPMLFFFAELAT